MIPAIVILNILGIGAAFMLGKYHERVKWNTLITKGVLPTPDEAMRKLRAKYGA